MWFYASVLYATVDMIMQQLVTEKSLTKMQTMFLFPLKAQVMSVLPVSGVFLLPTKKTIQSSGLGIGLNLCNG